MVSPPYANIFKVIHTYTYIYIIWCRTKVVKKTYTPEWGETFRLSYNESAPPPVELEVPVMTHPMMSDGGDGDDFDDMVNIINKMRIDNRQIPIVEYNVI